MNKRELSSESDDSDLVNLCSFLLPDVQRIVNDRRVSESSPIRPLLEDILRLDGIIPVLRKFSQAIQYPSVRRIHPSGESNTEFPRTLVSTFNNSIEDDGKTVRDYLRNKPANNSSHYPVIRQAGRPSSKYIGAAVVPPSRPIKPVLNTSKKPIPSTFQ
ncbi:hypothetical protein BHYA_0551g00010 [Botrytis hyacinthi]|uniref:Uncharacterized protein n=1 Tax=Botrytis hyacinthi TaxID=278943 RepID=A0A4Z1GBL0_9HELO|nr:hypothetical protein BHYA_0551g00010 [Botrytis hyacinthi]